MQNVKKRKGLKIILLCLLLLLIAGIAGIGFYLSDYSRAKEEAITVMADSSAAITNYDWGVTFGNTDAKCGFIFYPGGKVEYTAYAPLLQAITQGDILCVLPRMPFNLAVFDSKAAKDLLPEFPNVEHWFIGGHSLGGAMAADYAGNNPDEFDGLILLAAYSASDISDSNLAVLSIYGSEDKVLNMDKYAECKSYLPAGYEELCIEGGNHAQYGDYGLQDGDGTAAITAAKQRQIASDRIIDFINEVTSASAE